MSDRDFELAKALLDSLDVPAGSANTFFRDRNGGQLVVWLGPEATVPPDRRPKTFNGVRVVYERLPTVRLPARRRQ